MYVFAQDHRTFALKQRAMVIITYHAFLLHVLPISFDQHIRSTGFLNLFEMCLYMIYGACISYGIKTICFYPFVP